MRSGEGLTNGERALSGTWLKVTEALEGILDGTNFAQIARGVQGRLRAHRPDDLARYSLVLGTSSD